MKNKILFLILFLPFITILINSMEQAEYQLGSGTELLTFEPETPQPEQQELTAITELQPARLTAITRERPAKRAKTEESAEFLAFGPTGEVETESESEEEAPAPEIQVEEPLEVPEAQPQLQIPEYRMRTIRASGQFGPIYSIALSTDKKYVSILYKREDFYEGHWFNKGFSLDFETGNLFAWPENIIKSGKVIISCDGNSLIFLTSTGHILYKWPIGLIQNIETLTKFKPSLIIRNIAVSCDDIYTIGLSFNDFYIYNKRQANASQRYLFNIPSYFKDPTRKLIISPQNNYIVAYYKDGLFIFNRATGELLANKKYSYNQTPPVAVSHDDKHLIIGLGNGSIQILNLPTLQPIKTFIAHQLQTTAITISYNNKFIISGSLGGIKIWDFDGNLQKIQHIPNDTISALTTAPDGTIVAGSALGFIYIFEPIGAVA